MKVIDLMCRLDPVVGCTSIESLKEFAELMIQIRRDHEFWEEVIKLSGLNE